MMLASKHEAKGITGPQYFTSSAICLAGKYLLRSQTWNNNARLTEDCINLQIDSPMKHYVCD